MDKKTVRFILHCIKIILPYSSGICQHSSRGRDSWDRGEHVAGSGARVSRSGAGTGPGGGCPCAAAVWVRVRAFLAKPRLRMPAGWLCCHAIASSVLSSSSHHGCASGLSSHPSPCTAPVRSWLPWLIVGARQRLYATSLLVLRCDVLFV